MKIREINFGDLIKKGAQKVGQATGAAVRGVKGVGSAFAQGYSQQQGGQPFAYGSAPKTAPAQSQTTATTTATNVKAEPAAQQAAQAKPNLSASDPQILKIIKSIDDTNSVDALKKIQADLEKLKTQSQAATRVAKAGQPKPVAGQTQTQTQ